MLDVSWWVVIIDFVLMIYLWYQANISEYGTNGTFGGERLFNCGDGKAILIPVDELGKSCEAGMDFIGKFYINLDKYFTQRIIKKL